MNSRRFVKFCYWAYNSSIMPNNHQDDHQEFAESYKLIRRDVRFVVVTNIFILAALAGLYFLNQKYSFIDALLKRF